jgi:hypothetical protein
MTLAATVISAHLPSHLAPNPMPAAVHSVFSRTVNIICDDSTWLCIHPESVLMHPYAVRVGCGDGGGTWPHAEAAGFLGVSQGDAASVSKAYIRFERRHLEIDLGRAELWNARLVPLAAGRGWDPEKMAATLAGLIGGRPVASAFLAASLERDFDTGDAWSRAVLRRAGRIVECMERDLREGSLNISSAAVEQAIGTGWGLTPSGDDFLTGLLAAHSYLGPTDGVDRHALGRLRALLHRTTLPSAMMLEAALEGLFPEALGGLMTSLAHGCRMRISMWLEHLTQTGATSGEDMLAGLLTYLRSAATGCVHAAH